MSASSILTRRSLRKTKGQFAIVGLLVALASMQLHLAYVLLTDYPANLNRTADRLNTEDVALFLTSEESRDAVTQKLDTDKRVSEYAVSQASVIASEFDYGGNMMSAQVLVTEHGKKTDIGKVETVEELQDRQKNPIWLPLTFKSGGYDLGDTFTLTTSEREHNFQVQGFTVTPMHSMTSMGVIEVQTEAASVQTLAASPTAEQLWRIQVKASHGPDLSLALTKVAEAAHTGPGAAVPGNLERQAVFTIQTLTSNSFVAMLALFSLIFTLIVATVIRFVIRSTVVRDMPAIGTLGAVGFRPGHIMRVLALPFVVVTVAAALLGAAATVPLLSVLEDVLTSQTGIPWDASPSAAGTVIALAALLSCVALTGVVAAWHVRKIPPVQALRGGRKAHSFHSNRLPLASSRGRAPALLGLKSALHSKAQNAMVVLVLAVAVTASTIGLGIFSVVNGNPKQFSQMVIGERGDVTVLAAQGQSAIDLRKDLAGQPGVDKAVVFDNDGISNTTLNDTPAMLKITEDFSVFENNLIYEGRIPRREDEIVIGGHLAQLLNVSVGDEVTLEHLGKKERYLVTGLSQSVSNLGREAMMTVDGARRVNPSYVPQKIDVYLDSSFDTQTFIERTRNSFPTRIAQFGDLKATFDAGIGTYVSASVMIAIAIIALTLVAILLIVGLVVSLAMAQSRRDYGILKSLGFTNRQLATYTLYAHLPAIILGTAVGLVIGSVTAMPLLQTLLSNVGIMRLSAALPVHLVAVMAVAVLALSATLMLMLARKTRSITSRDLLTE
ncbi:MAG: FtsX-like permease family protein [Actinomycetaceae bacterium]|nr:FtsX-like permease family protein [Actinomycetaceae bacterium]